MSSCNNSRLTLLEEAYEQRAPLLDQINRVAPWHLLYRRQTWMQIDKLIFPGARVLDLACGTGIFAEAILSKAASLTLVDVLPNMIDLSKERLERLGFADRLVFALHDICSDAEADFGRYDVVIMTQALNFFPGLGPVFRFAKRHLTPTGIFYFDIDTAFRWAMIETISGNYKNAVDIATKSCDVGRQIVGADYYFYNRTAISDMLHQCELNMDTCGGICPVSPYIHILNKSSDFLDCRRLKPEAALYLEEEGLLHLEALDRQFAHVAVDTAGWSVFQASAKAP